MGLKDDMEAAENYRREQALLAAQKLEQDTREAEALLREFVHLARERGLPPRRLPAFGKSKAPDLYYTPHPYDGHPYPSTVTGWRIYSPPFQQWAVGEDAKLYGLADQVGRLRGDRTPKPIEPPPLCVDHHSHGDVATWWLKGALMGALAGHYPGAPPAE